MVLNEDESLDGNGSNPAMMSLEDRIAQLTHLITQMASAQLQQQQHQQQQNHQIRFSFNAYDPAETIEDYFNRFELQLKLCKVDEALWAAHARVHMGQELNTTLTSIAYPTKVETLTFEQIKTQLTSHIMKSKNKFSEAIKFRKILQNPEESIAKYAARLKAGARYCQFEGFLDFSLSVQFIHGIICDDTRDEIVSRKPETFDAAVNIALTMEATREALTQLKPPTTQSEQTVNKFYDSRPKLKSNNTSPHKSSYNQYRNNNFRSRSHNQQHNRNRSKSNTSHPQTSTDSSTKQQNEEPCLSCGEAHDRNYCRLRNARCNYCKRQGHIAKVCKKAKLKNNAIYDPKPEHERDDETGYFQVSINRISCSVTNSEVNKVSSIELNHNKPSLNVPPPPCLISVSLNGNPLKMELDTGAACSIVSSTLFKNLLPNVTLHPTNRPLYSYTKNQFNCLGFAKVRVQFQSRVKTLNLFVIDFPGDPIFGRDWISHFSDLLPLNELITASVNQVQAPTNPFLTPNSSETSRILTIKV